MIFTHLAAAALLATLPAAAQNDPIEHTHGVAYAAIERGDYRAAERHLAALRHAHPDRPEVLLNLAAVYLRTDRTDAAVSLYRDVLAQRPVLMDLPSGATRSSHDIARTGLSLVSVTASRTR